MEVQENKIMRRKIYISIPITGLDYNRQREKADSIKMLLSKQGYEVINPFEIYVGANPTYGDYLGADVRAIIDHADEVFMCRGWKNSKGCQIERFVAETFGKKIKYESVEQPEIYYK